MRVNAETCGGCPYYRRKRWWRREGCDYPVMADRCPMEPSGPRLLSWDDAMQEEVVWMERRGVADIEMMAVVDYRGETYLQGIHETVLARDAAPQRLWGVEYVFWDGRPNEQQRAAVIWGDRA